MNDNEQINNNIPVKRLRCEPLTVSEADAKKVFGLNDNWRPHKYIRHDFEVQGAVVMDYATGLMWQKAGSDGFMTYSQAQKYVETLNRQRFAGYDDWRLPTIPELMSLLEPKELNGDLYIDPMFDPAQRWCWSADIMQTKDESSSGAAWDVHFRNGRVGWHLLRNGYVRGVRS